MCVPPEKWPFSLRAYCLETKVKIACEGQKVMIFIYEKIILICFVFILLRILVNLFRKEETVRDWYIFNREILWNLFEGEKEEKFEGFDVIFSRLPQYSGMAYILISKIIITFLWFHIRKNKILTKLNHESLSFINFRRSKLYNYHVRLVILNFPKTKHKYRKLLLNPPLPQIVKLLSGRKGCHYFGKCHYLGFDYYEWAQYII